MSPRILLLSKRMYAFLIWCTHRKIDANFSSLVSLSRVNSVIDYSFAGPGLSGDWANQQQINRLSSTTESTNDIFFICSSISY